MEQSAPKAEKKTAQLLLCQSEAQQGRARELFPKLEALYVNGGDWSAVEGRRCVCLGQDLAVFAVGYAAEVKILPEAIPDEILTSAQAMAWAKAKAQTYSAGQAGLSPQADSGTSPPADLPGPVPAEPVPEANTADLSLPEPPQGWEADWRDALSQEPVAQPEGWLPPRTDMGEPADLWGQDTELPVMPADVMPAALAAYITDEAEVMGCDPGMLALYCTAICAGVVTDEIRLQVKASSDRWQESARIWAMIVGDSGLTMKSPTLDMALSHAWKIERELRLKGSEALKEYALECQIYEAQKAEYVKQRAKGNPATAPTEPALPTAERLIIGNATLEAISEVLLQQGARGALVVADELLGIIAGMNQYKGGKGSDRQDWLEMWNGGPHPIDRKGRAVLIKNWSVSIIGGTQPDAIARQGDKLEEDGLLQRFTIYAPRHSTRGLDREPDATSRRRYAQILDRLQAMTPQPTLAPVHFAPDAVPIVNDAREWIFTTARASWLSAGLRSHLAKWPAMLARLCLTYAAIEAADEQHAAIQPVISADITSQVWRMMRGTLWPHAEHFYLNVLAGDSPSRAAVRQIAGLILASGAREIDTRTMTQRSSAYRSATIAVRREILSMLTDWCWISHGTGHSPTTGLPVKFKVNAAVHETFAERAAIEREERAIRRDQWDAAKAEKAADRVPGTD